MSDDFYKEMYRAEREKTKRLTAALNAIIDSRRYWDCLTEVKDIARKALDATPEHPKRVNA